MHIFTKVNSSDSLSYQWQRSDDGVQWYNISDDTIYLDRGEGIFDSLIFIGTNSDTLFIYNMDSIVDSTFYRVLVDIPSSPCAVETPSSVSLLQIVNDIDLDNDGAVELIVIPEIINVDKNNPWLYVFRGSASVFKNEPLSYTKTPLSLTAMRPSSVTILSDPSFPLGVCFASPVRKGMIFNLQITKGQLKLINPRLLSGPSNNNGYGAIQMSRLSSNKREYVSILSVEKDSLYTTIFDVEDNFKIDRS
mgnify:CR=1 FL=1